MLLPAAGASPAIEGATFRRPWTLDSTPDATPDDWIREAGVRERDRPHP